MMTVYVSDAVLHSPSRPTLASEVPNESSYMSEEGPDYCLIDHLITIWFLRRQMFPRHQIDILIM